MPSPSPKDVPFARGLNGVLRFFLDTGSGSQEIVLRFKTWKIDQNVTEVQDDVGGEDASRVDIVHNYWELTGDVFYRDATFLRAALADIQTNQAGVAPLPKQANFKIVARDDSKFAGTFKGSIALGPFGLSMGSRQDAFMQNFKVRAAQFEEGKAA